MQIDRRVAILAVILVIVRQEISAVGKEFDERNPLMKFERN